jgi:hypothetical protein
MKRSLNLILLTLAIGSCLASYADGRWALSILGLPTGILVLLVYLLVCLLCIVTLMSKGLSRRERGWRLFFVAVSLMVIGLPWVVDDGYYWIGRRDHVRSLFSQELIAQIVHGVKTKPLTRELTPADLPAQVGASPWGFPGYAHCYFPNGATGSAAIELSWGGSLIGRHGLLITDERIPFHGFPVHGGETDAPSFPERYYPFMDGAYIVIDKD